MPRVFYKPDGSIKEVEGRAGDDSDCLEVLSPDHHEASSVTKSMSKRLLRAPVLGYLQRPRKEVKKMPTGTCPECEGEVVIESDDDKGGYITCEGCGTELEIMSIDPVELEIMEEETFDENDEEDEF